MHISKKYIYKLIYIPMYTYKHNKHYNGGLMANFLYTTTVPCTTKTGSIFNTKASDEAIKKGVGCCNPAWSVFQYNLMSWSQSLAIIGDQNSRLVIVLFCSKSRLRSPCCLLLLDSKSPGKHWPRERVHRRRSHCNSATILPSASASPTRWPSSNAHCGCLCLKGDYAGISHHTSTLLHLFMHKRLSYWLYVLIKNWTYLSTTKASLCLCNCPAAKVL